MLQCHYVLFHGRQHCHLLHGQQWIIYQPDFTHKLIVEIKLMELKLGCHLVVIHVPGVLMINQETDGLSRGVWVSPFRNRYQHKIYLLASSLLSL